MNPVSMISVLPSIFLATLAFGESNYIRVVSGTVYPLPDEDTAVVSFRNTSNQTVVCTVKIQGIVKGTSPQSGREISASVYSDGIEGVRLSAGRVIQQTFNFHKEISRIRSVWGDSSAELVAVNEDTVDANCRIDTGAADPTPVELTEPAVYQIKSPDGLNCRLGMGTQYEIQRTFKNGSFLYAIEAQKDYRNASYLLTESGCFVRGLSTYLVKAPQRTLSSLGAYVVVSPDGVLNCRQGPSTGYPIDYVFRAGETVYAEQSGQGELSAPWFLTHQGCYVRASSAYLGGPLN